MEKILVAGAGGFIGHHLTRFLKNKGYWVRGVDVKYPEFSARDEADEFLLLDLRDFRNCVEAVRGTSKIYQLAADMGGIGFITSHGVEPYQNSLLINLNMAEAARLEGARILFSSSACGYPVNKLDVPNPPPIKEDEAYPALPNEDYGWEKLTSEKIYQAYSRDCGLDIRIARYDNTYGPEGTYEGGREKAPAAICRKIAMADDAIEIWGDGKQARAFLYISDNNEGTYRLMESDIRAPVNLASNELVSIDELVDIASRIAGKKLRKIYQLDKPQGVRGRLLDITKAQTAFGWQPKVSLEEGMALTYRWIENQIKSGLGA